MRVLFPFVGDTVGGSHISSWQLMCGLQHFSIEPIIVVHEEGVYTEWLKNQGSDYEVVKLPHIRTGDGPLMNSSRIIKGAFQAKSFLHKLNIDLIHCNDSRMNRTWAPWAMFSAIPMVWHQRSSWSFGKQVKASLCFTSGVISTSNFVANMRTDLSMPHKVIYNPIAVENLNNALCNQKLKNELGLSDQTRIIGCFANSKRLKRPDTFIQAASSLKEKGITNFIFIWFGDDRDGMLSQCLSEIEPSCPVMHIPFRTEVMSIIAGCDILIATSERDAFGRTLIEGMSLGIPVVASNAGGHSEIIEDGKNGLLFPVGNADACATSIIRIFNESDLKEILIKAGKTTTEKYEPKRHAEEVVSFYHQLKDDRSFKQNSDIHQFSY